MIFDLHFGHMVFLDCSKSRLKVDYQNRTKEIIALHKALRPFRFYKHLRVYFIFWKKKIFFEMCGTLLEVLRS